MKRDFQNGTETVQVAYMLPKRETDVPQDVNIQTLLFPIPVSTGDVALAAMTKGLVEYLLKPVGELGQTIELDPKIMAYTEEVLTGFKADIEAAKKAGAASSLIVPG